MRRVQPGCDLIGNQVKSKITSLYEGMRDSSVFKENLGDTATAFRQIFENETGVKLEDSEFFPPSPGELRAVGNRIQDIKKYINKGGKIAPSFWSKFYATSALADRMPTVKGLVEEYIKVNYEMKGRQHESNQLFRGIVSNLKRESIERNFKWKKFKNPKAKADKLESDKVKALAVLKDSPPNTNEYKDALKVWNAAVKAESDFYNRAEGKVFKDLVYHIEENVVKADTDFINKHLEKQKIDLTIFRAMTKSEQKKVMPSLSSRQKNIINSISSFKDVDGKVISGNMVSAVQNHFTLMDGMFKTQEQGLVKWIEGVRMSLEESVDSTAIEGIVDKLKERIMPEYRVGYYHHQIIDQNAGFMEGIMPHIEQVSQATSLKLVGNNDQSVNDALKGLDTYLTGYERARQPGSDLDYSKNYLTVTKNYIDEINRFNYISNSNTASKNAILEVAKVWNKGDGEMHGFAKTMHDFIVQLHAAQTGHANIKNPEIDAGLKFMLGAQFVSKLGWNMRSGLRNATQSVLNWQHFGFTANKRANDYIRENALGEEIDNHLRNKGLLFLDLAPELQEAVGLKGAAHKVIEVDSEGNVRFKAPGILEKGEKAFREMSQSGLGEYLSPGSIMQKVENYNRKRTYKTAYAIMHQKLQNNHAFRLSTGKSADQFSASVRSRADRFATNMVTMLHFDYSDVSKSQAMRSPLGKVLFQFQHYGVKFFEYNMKTLKGMKNDWLEGQALQGQNAWRAYRMAMIYFIGVQAAESLTGIGFSKLLQHDTQQRLSQIATVLTGTTEEIAAATHNRGLTGIAGLGGPMVSDSLRIANLTGVIDQNSSDFARFAAGYEEAALFDGDRDLYEISSILSTAGTRFFGNTLPMALNGHMGRAMQHEFGLYPTKEARGKKKFLIDTVSDATDNSAVLASLDYIQNFPKKGKKKPAKQAPSSMYNI